MAKKKIKLPTAPVRIEVRMVREGTVSTPVKIKTPGDASDYADELRSYDREVFAVILLDAKNNALGLHIATVGVLDASLINPGAVFKAAMLANAAAVVLLHNHPSGDPSPSPEDIKVTKQLIEAGKTLELKVIDHVIIGSTAKFLSIREEGLISFN